ncbi:MAG: CBS domain-containing protein [Burkholderiales bacterium]|jgi:CBS domain-containing protein|nr:CBS domain-containing protein [Burkholderiales bacterium]
MRAKTAAVSDLATREVVMVGPPATLLECAQAMRNRHVGSLVVADAAGKPLGIVTDRDLVVEALALQLDPATLTAGDVMSTPVATVRLDDDLFDALARMRERGVRRLPVVDAQGRAVGVLAVDDLLGVLAEQVDSVVRVLKAEQTREAVTRQ